MSFFTKLLNLLQSKLIPVLTTLIHRLRIILSETRADTKKKLTTHLPPITKKKKIDDIILKFCYTRTYTRKYLSLNKGLKLFLYSLNCIRSGAQKH